jgi:bifunctional non-homologous end joining protein LigD
MLATPGTLPIGANWAFQAKLDGIRLIAALSGGELRLRSRNEKDLTSGFPELRVLGEALRAAGTERVLLDGELVASGSGRVPSLGNLAGRIHRRTADDADVAANPVTYVIFDLLQSAGSPVMGQSYDRRQELLRDRVPPGPLWTIAENFDDGAALWEATAVQGLEGVVSKRRTSTYTPGVRSPNWIKSVHRSLTEVVIYGWRFEEGRRGSRIGSLMVARPHTGGLRAVGRVGSGMTQELSDALLPVLQSIEVDTPAVEPLEDPRGTAYWCDPILVAEVRHLGTTADGALRHPVLARVRSYITADDLDGS